MGRRRVLDVTVVTDYTGLVFQHASVTDLMGRPVISYARDTRYAVDRAAKRFLDMFCGLVFVVLSAIPFVLYSLYALSRGNRPLTRTARLGLEGEPFTIPTAGEDRPDGPSDFVNLPLFWLVAIGRLSIVGPYPLRPEEASGLEGARRFRFGARPGVTGFWRMRERPEAVLEDLIAQDADYLRNWSLSRDARIVLATLPRMVRGRTRNLVLADDQSSGRRSIDAD
jgi:lipopolysaccharide/colanic/teichoic acid biosynthesis glycosyltransferase